ncbi:madd-3, partial [Symbiodinium sp. CCMP2456]
EVSKRDAQRRASFRISALQCHSRGSRQGGLVASSTSALRFRACTRQFRSPEVALGLQWDEKLDIWSAGCIIAMLYTGVRPFSVLMDDRFPKHMLRTARRNRTDQDE